MCRSSAVAKSAALLCYQGGQELGMHGACKRPPVITVWWCWLLASPDLGFHPAGRDGRLGCQCVHGLQHLDMSGQEEMVKVVQFQDPRGGLLGLGSVQPLQLLNAAPHQRHAMACQHF
jgi:hypothetical protein